MGTRGGCPLSPMPSHGETLTPVYGHACVDASASPRNADDVLPGAAMKKRPEPRRCSLYPATKEAACRCYLPPRLHTHVRCLQRPSLPTSSHITARLRRQQQQQGRSQPRIQELPVVHVDVVQ